MSEPGVGGHAVRSTVLRVLMRIERGRRSDRSLDAVMTEMRLEPRDRRLATEIAYGTVRRQRSIDRTLAAFCSRPLERLDRPLRAALRMAVYQCVFVNSVPPHAAVHRSVEALKRIRPRAVGFANAVLRNWLRAGGQLDAGNGSLADRCELPDWLAERWQARGDDAGAWLEAALEPPPLTLRVAPGRSIEDLREVLGADASLVASPRVDGCVRVEGAEAARLRTAYETGVALPRGEAGQIVTALTGPEETASVLDACSGRGGKARQLAESGATVYCVDVDRDRLRAARELAAQAGQDNHRQLCADLDAAAPLRQTFGRILVDVPCSGLGTLRRHPEIKWRVRPEDLARLAARQRRILTTCLRLLEPGGELLYVTCSTEPEENEEVVDAVLADAPGCGRRVWSDVPAGGRVDATGDLRTFPGEADLDGFYVARLTRLGAD